VGARNRFNRQETKSAKILENLGASRISRTVCGPPWCSHRGTLSQNARRCFVLRLLKFCGVPTSCEGPNRVKK
jgi:hypothetical protein